MDQVGDRPEELVECLAIAPDEPGADDELAFPDGTARRNLQYMPGLRFAIIGVTDLAWALRSLAE